MGSPCHCGYVPEPAGESRSRRRRRLTAFGAPLLLAAVPVLAGVLLVGAAGPAAATGQAAAAPAPVPTAAPASAGGPAGPSRLCQVADPRLPEISGLADAGGKLLAMNDGGRPAGGVRTRQRRARWSTSAPAGGQPVRRGGPGPRRRRQDLAGRHRRQPAPGRRSRCWRRGPTADGRLPADLPGRQARRRGDAAGARGTPYLVTKENPRLGSGVPAGRAAGRRARPAALARVATVTIDRDRHRRVGRSGRPVSCGDRGSGVARRQGGRAAHLHRRVRVPGGRRRRREGARSRPPVRVPLPPTRTGRGHHVRPGRDATAVRVGEIGKTTSSTITTVAARQRWPHRPHRRPRSASPLGPETGVSRSAPVVKTEKTRRWPVMVRRGEHWCCRRGLRAPVPSSSVSALVRAGGSDPAQHGDDLAEDGRVVAGDRLERRVVRHQPDLTVACA